MPKLLIIFLLSFTFCTSVAQNTINRYEYWFDNDYAGKLAVPVTPVTTLNLNQNISTAALSTGLHIFNIRFKDANGFESPVISQHFFKTSSPGSLNNIIRYEYWFDNNYGGKISQTVPPQNSLQLITGIDANNLIGGLHIFNIRFKDERGIWGSTVSQHFFKASSSGGANNIVAYEYWFDNNYAGKISQTISPQSTLQIISGIDADSLVSGLHIFNIRFKDERKQWSAVVSQHFYKANISATPNFINGYRYWIDTAISSITTVNIPVTTNPKYVFEQINFASLDTGAHIITMQFRDLQNMWSSLIVDTFYQLGEARLDTITPAKGGNTGDVTVAIKGTGFYAGTTVKLTRSGFPDIIVPDSMMSIDHGQVINATFDLHNQIIGFRNLVVTVPGDTVMTINNAFEIIPGIAPNPFSEIIGFNAIRVGQWQSFILSYGNSGNVDATGVPLYLAVSDTTAEVELVFAVGNPLDTNYNYSIHPDHFIVDTVLGEPMRSKVYAFFIPHIPPEYVGALTFRIKINSSQQARLATWTTSPFFGSGISFQQAECIHDIISLTAGIVGVAAPHFGCVFSLLNAGLSPLIFTIAYPDQYHYELYDFFKSMTGVLTSCISYLNPAIALSHSQKTFVRITKTFIGGLGTGSSCYSAFSNTRLSRKSLTPVASFDPNDKIGPTGTGLNQFVSDSRFLEYLIHFENVDTATASAQNILIIDTLDVTKFDLSTLQLGLISLGDTIIRLPAGTKHFSTNIDLRPNNDLVVRITADLNEETGVLTWNFNSLDPITLTPTNNPLAGFLPPNITAPEGEGSVFYSVKVKDTILNNSIVSNKAYIIFDNNPPIVTNNWTNTIDNIKPHSKVDSLPTITLDSTFTVKWRGADTSSGVLQYSVYYSVNGGLYRHWKINTRDTLATFFGRMDSTYRFYSIATDSALNVESAPIIFDAITTTHRCNTIAVVNTSGPIVFCEGDSVVLSANANMRNYLWSNGATIRSIVVKTSGTYSVTIIDSFTCQVNSQQINVTVNPKPSQPGIISGNTSVLIGQNLNYSVTPITNATGYNWQLSGGGTITNGQNTNTITISWTTIGNYTLSVNGINSCGNGPIRSQNDTVSLSTGIVNVDDQFQIKVVPNPSTGEFYLTAKRLINKDIKIEVLDNLGNIVSNTQQRVLQTEFNKMIDLKKMADGVYYIKISVANKVYIRTVVKVN